MLPEGLELHRLVPRVFGGRGRRGACGLLQHRRARGHGGAHRHAAGSSGPTGESAGHHGRSPRAVRHLRAPGHLRPARSCQYLQPGRRPGPAARAGALGRRFPAAARQQQVHQVHALRGHLREGAALRRVGLHWGRPFHEDHRARQPAHRRGRLRPVRPVHHPLPHRCACGSRRREPHHGGHPGSGGGNRGAGGAGRAHGLGRGPGAFPRGGDAGTLGRGPARRGLRQGLRHRFRRRPHHYGGGQRVRGIPRLRRAAPHVHELLSRLGALREAALPAVHGPAFQRQIAAPDDGRGGEEHAGGRGRRGGTPSVRCVHHALRGEEVRVRRAGAFHGGRCDPWGRHERCGLGARRA